MTTAEKTTQVIAGHRITLQPGCRYIAGRPMAGRGQNLFPVHIRLHARDLCQDPLWTVDGLDYDAANELLAAFNNGENSWAGRVWEGGDNE
jgi:hypothetical protein